MLHPSFLRQTKNINNVSFSQRGNIREASARKFVKNCDVISPELVCLLSNHHVCGYRNEMICDTKFVKNSKGFLRI